MGTQTELALVGLVALNVETDGGATATGTGQTDNHAAAVVELGIQALVLGDAAVQVSVREVAGVNNLASTDGGADEGVAVGDKVGKGTDDLVSTLAIDVLVVVASEEGAAVSLPELVLDRGNAGGLAGLLLGDTSNDVQPSDNSPQTVLLADVVATSAEALLATDGHLLLIEEVAEELPTGGDLVALKALGLGHAVDGTGSGHGTSQTVDTLLLEVGDELSMVGNDGQAVAGGDKCVGTVDHVTVTVTIAGGTEVDAVVVNGLDELVGIYQVGIGVTATKVRLGLAVHGAAGGQTEFLDEDVHAVGTGHTVHAVEEHLEVLVGAQELLDQIEIKDLLHHSDVVGGGVHDLDLEGTVALGTNGGGVDIGDVGNLVGGQGLGGGEDLVGDALGGGGTVGQVVLDTKVVFGT